MSKLALGAVAAFAVLSGGTAEAGMVKGAAEGAVVGHVAGHHAATGAAIGAVAGHHHAAKKAKAAGK